MMLIIKQWSCINTYFKYKDFKTIESIIELPKTSFL